MDLATRHYEIGYECMGKRALLLTEALTYVYLWRPSRTEKPTDDYDKEMNTEEFD